MGFSDFLTEAVKGWSPNHAKKNQYDFISKVLITSVIGALGNKALNKDKVNVSIKQGSSKASFKATDKNK